MSEKQDEPQHGGVLMQGPTGELWFLRDDYPAPVRIKESYAELIEVIQDFSKTVGDQFMTFPIPEEIVKLLNESEYGPVSPLGIFHCKTQ